MFELISSRVLLYCSAGSSLSSVDTNFWRSWAAFNLVSSLLLFRPEVVKNRCGSWAIFSDLPSMYWALLGRAVWICCVSHFVCFLLSCLFLNRPPPRPARTSCTFTAAFYWAKGQRWIASIPAMNAMKGTHTCRYSWACYIYVHVITMQYPAVIQWH